MPEGDSVDSGIDTLESQLLGKVPLQGTIWNKALQTKLEADDWDEQRFWLVRDALLSKGVLKESAGGRGGSVARAHSIDWPGPEVIAPTTKRQGRLDTGAAQAQRATNQQATPSDLDITKLESQLLAKVPAEGTIGNKSLRSQLETEGWDEQRYWSTRNGLIEKGVLEKGGGQGGSVRRAAQTVAAAKPLTTPSTGKPLRELDLHGPMLKVIQTDWSQDHEFRPGETFAWKSAGKKTQGKWTCPDITLIGRKRFAYYPETVYEFVTFEIKPSDDFNVNAVYEALAHRRSATRSYVLLHLPDYKADSKTNPEEPDSPLGTMVAEATRQGVGLIVATEPEDYNTWATLVDAPRQQPDPAAVSEYLALQIRQTRQKDLQQGILELIHP